MGVPIFKSYSLKNKFLTDFKIRIMKRKGKNSEKILSQIKLKYHKNSEIEKEHDRFLCYVCKKKSKEVGSFLEYHLKKPKIICKDCSIEMYQAEHGYKNKEAAASRRRRVFDVAYLFNEIIIDEYLNCNEIKSVDDLKEKDMKEIMNLSATYNELLSKEEKGVLEEMEKQSDIEKDLKEKVKKLFWILDWDKKLKKRILKIKKMKLKGELEWEMDYSEISRQVLKDELGNAFHPLMLAIIHPDSRFAITVHIANPSSNYLLEFLDKTLEVIEKKEFYPKKIAVKKQELYDMLRDVFKDLNIEVKLVKRTRSVESFKRTFSREFLR